MRKILMPAAPVLAVILLIVSLVMFGILVKVAVGLARGGEIASRSWIFPLIILGTGAVMMSFLRKPIALHLYLAAFALWLLTTGYYVVNFRLMVP